MTLFGIVWLLFLFTAVITNKRSMLVTLVLISSTLQSSSVLVINGYGIGPQIITSGVVALYFMASRFKKMKFKVSKKLITTNKILMVMVAYIIFDAIRTTTFGTNILKILQLLIYLICFFEMKNVGETLNHNYVYCTLKRISIFILAVGVFQILATTNIIPRYWFIQDIFWNEGANNQGNVQFMWSNGSYFRFFSTYMEPSYFVGFSLGALFYFFNYSKNRRNDLPLIAMLLLATILSFSSSGYGALLITVLLYIAFSKEWKMKSFLLLGGMIGFGVFYFGFYNILDSVIFSKMQSGSAVARIMWNNKAMRTFQGSPLMGVGYKNCRASSMFYTIAAELGIIGIVLYVAFIFSIVWPVFTKQGQKLVGEEQVGVIFAIIAVTSTQMIAVPDFDICTFWMWMNFLGLIIGRNKRRKRLSESE